MSERTEKTAEIISHFLHELETPYKPLTQWEEGFIESVTEQFQERGTLSDRQFEILEKIYAEKTA